MILKNIVPAEQVETLKNLLDGRSKMPLNALQIQAEMQEFAEKKDHAELFKLQYGIIIKNLHGKVLVTYREDSENGEARITSGHSVVTSGSSFKKAYAKLQNIDLDLSNYVKEEVSINGMYVFIVRTYIIPTLPDEIQLSGTDKKAEAVSIEDAVQMISEKAMELSLLSEEEKKETPENTKIKKETDLSKKDIQPK